MGKAKSYSKSSKHSLDSWTHFAQILQKKVVERVRGLIPFPSPLLPSELASRNFQCVWKPNELPQCSTHSRGELCLSAGWDLWLFFCGPRARLLSWSEDQDRKWEEENTGDWNQVPLKLSSPAEFMINLFITNCISFLVPPLFPSGLRSIKQKRELKPSRTLWGPPGCKSSWCTTILVCRKRI